ncbi:lipoprotein [Spiroplasma taiwanense]|uniref:Lipoprotein n=1 Tax=Spiroplasma taiwanense CT-1 TaxID=1276220 RepID=S5MBC1_9MOLU|nr:lipoprotein [Spiroplasma taiwanense]AGR41068.1 hypothetical protein STAIW_v1c04210 [Spiroplasma taiwanense CT-1]
MKKLLNLLATTSLVASTSLTVIACGNNSNSNETVPDPNEKEPEPEVVYEDVLRDFESDLTSFKDTYWNSKKSNFFASTTGSESKQFFIEEDIKKIVDKAKEPGAETNIYDILTTPQKGALKTDIENTLAASELTSYFSNNIDKEKYSILLDGSDLGPTLDYDWNTLTMDYTNDALGGETSNFISYTSVDVKFVFNYKDKIGETQKFEITQKYIFTLTSDNYLIQAIQEMENKIQTDYFLANEKYSILDNSNFDLKDENLGNIFGTSNDDMKTAFEKTYSSDDFKNNITSFITTNYFENLQNIPLEFAPGSLIFQSYSETDYLKTDTSYNKQLSTPAGLNIYNNIFNNMKTEGSTTLMGATVNNVNNIIHADLRSNYTNYLSSFNTKINNFVETLKNSSEIVPTETFSENLSNSFSYGIVKLKGLEIISGDYHHPINELSIYTSLAVKKDETKENREAATVSNIFAAMYYNTIAGIKKFQEIFGIVDRTDTGEVSPLVRFTGTRQGTEYDSNQNIWSQGFTADNNQYLNKLKQSMSLTTTNLKKFRDYILNESNQRIFNWALYKENFSTTSNIGLSKNTKGIYIKYKYYNGEPSLNIHFEQNFVNYYFNVAEIWTSSGTVVIETMPTV